MENKLINRLNDIKKWINENPTVIQKDHSDGRIDSLLGEKQVADKLVSHFPDVEVKKGNRSFGDIYLNIDGVKYPVNIKLTSKSNTSNDNLVGLVGLMSHILFDGKGGSNHKDIAKKIVEGKFSDIENDYGFISITKEDGIAEISSIITMEGYIANPANTFQANFNKIKTVDKSFEEGRQHLINMYKLWHKKRSEAYLILDGII